MVHHNKKALIRIIIPLFLLLTAGWLYCLHLENKLLYVPQYTHYPDVSLNAVTDEAFRNKIQVLHFQSLDKTMLTAWFVPAEKNHPTVLYAHGNAGNVTNNWDLMDSFVQKGYGFLAVDYRGFGHSAGTPSEHGLYEDIKAASLLLVNQYHVPITSQIMMGGSLGGAVAIEDAQSMPYKAVVILCSFTSASDMGYIYMHRSNLDFLRWVPLPWLVTQPFDSIRKIKNINVPLLIIHSKNDTRIPFDMGVKLYNASTRTPRKKLYADNYIGHSITSGVVCKQVFAFLKTQY